MFKITEKRFLCENVVYMSITAPFVAKKVAAGQFIILRIDEYGERIPLTVADFEKEKGTVSIIFQAVGNTTKRLSKFFGGMPADPVDYLGLANPTGLARD